MLRPEINILTAVLQGVNEVAPATTYLRTAVMAVFLLPV